MKFGKIKPGAIYYDGFVKLYETTLTATTASSVSITGLAGNTDTEYILEGRIVSGAAAANFGVRPNNDASLYGHQYLTGNDTTAAASRTTGAYMWLSNSGIDATEICQFNLPIYAKSGYVRTGITASADEISGTTVTQINLIGQVHDDTSTEYTSLVIASDQTNGIGSGSYICLWGKRATT